MHDFWTWFLTVTGTHIPAGQYSDWYNFWSGFGSDIGEITIATGLITLYKAHECHIDKCHRIGKHPFKHYKLCKKHHPDTPDKVTVKHIGAIIKDKEIT